LLVANQVPNMNALKMLPLVVKTANFGALRKSLLLLENIKKIFNLSINFIANPG
jgi:hypothetical protein